MSKKKMSNIGIKVSAVIIAIILWSFVMDDVDPEREREIKNVPVTFINVSSLERQGLVIMEPQEVTVDVKLVGRKSDLDGFDQENILAQVDLSGYSEGQVRVGLNVGITGQASSVRVASYQPREVLFTLDTMVTREYPVSIVTVGELDEGYLLDTIDTSAYNISLTGPRTWMNEVHRVVVHVDLEGRTSSTTTNFAVTVVDDEGNEVRGIEREPSMVNLNIPILRSTTLPIELKTSGELPENFQMSNLKIEPSEVKIKGSSDILNLTKIDTEVIDVNSFLESSSQEVELVLPRGVQLVDPDTTITISYDIEETIQESLEFTIEEIIRNLPEGLSVDEESSAQLINVNISGDRATIEDIEKADISLVLDLNELEVGTHEIEVRVEDIEGVNLEIDPRTVTITLTDL